MPGPYARPMGMLVKLVLGVALTAAAGPAVAAPRDLPERSQAIRIAAQQRVAQNLPVKEIERRVIPTMGDATYLGFLYDPATNIYTLKFLRNGSVIWVDVDGRTGRIVRRSGR
jgi:hypothetical protein